MNGETVVTELWPRFLRAARGEFAPLQPRKVLAEAASVWLPKNTFNRTRTAFLRSAGVRIGPRSLIQGAVEITGIGKPSLLSIGTSTMLSGGLHVDLGARVSIGDHVRIGHDVSLLTISHEIGTADLRCGFTRCGAIEIGNGAWIASKVIVLANVSIGAGAVVAAGSVVTRDVAPNTLVAGVPARFVRTLGDNG